MKTSGAGLLCSWAWLVSACGSAASYNYELPPSPEDQQPALATMYGQTAGEPTGADPARVRFALVWFPVSPAAGKIQFTQFVRHQSLGLNAFQLSISQPPPAKAVESASAMRYAQAEVILYEDRNDNKVLDLVEPGANRVDRVIGRAKGLRVWWLGEGSPAGSDQRGYKPVQEGWSFTYGPIQAAPTVRDCDPDREMGGTWKPVCKQSTIKEAQDISGQSDGFVLTVSNDDKLQSYACRGFWGTSSDKSDEWPDTTPGWKSPVRNKICNPETCDTDGTGAVLDLPVQGRNVKIECSDTKMLYRWRDCAPDPELCGTVFCHDGKGVRDPDKQPPANWPAECL